MKGKKRNSLQSTRKKASALFTDIALFLELRYQKLCGTCNLCGQKCEHILALNGCLVICERISLFSNRWVNIRINGEVNESESL